MDAVLCSMYAGTQQSQAMRSHSLRMWLGMVTAMAIVIEYYVPDKFRKRSERWIPPEQSGKIIPFPAQERSWHDEKTDRLVHASKMGWFGGQVWNSKEQISSNANLL